MAGGVSSHIFYGPLKAITCCSVAVLVPYATGILLKKNAPQGHSSLQYGCMIYLQRLQCNNRSVAQ